MNGDVFYNPLTFHAKLLNRQVVEPCSASV
jgi:hypothetical protein